MPAIAPLTGEVLIGQLTDRLFAIYEQALECEVERIELRSAQRLIIAMAVKLGREFSELTNLLNRKDRFLDFWAGFEGSPRKGSEPGEELPFEFGFEDELKNMIALIGDKGTLSQSEVVSRVKGLLLSYARMVKRLYGERHAAVISAKLKEFESKRVPLKR